MFKPYTVEFNADYETPGFLWCSFICPNALSQKAIHSNQQIMRSGQVYKYLVAADNDIFKLGVAARALNQGMRFNDILEYNQFMIGQLSARVPDIWIERQTVAFDRPGARYLGRAQYVSLHMLFQTVGGTTYVRPAHDSEAKAYSQTLTTQKLVGALA